MTQVLGKIYSVLSDKDKRAIYDEDGTVDEEDSSVFSQVRNSYYTGFIPADYLTYRMSSTPYSELQDS